MHEPRSDKEKMKREFKSRLYNWTIRLINAIDDIPKETSSQIMAKQIIRCGTSIGANYIEAQAASSKKDFTNFLHYSLKSANETKFWLALMRDTNKIDRKKAAELLNEVNEISRILGASLLTVKGKR